MFTRTTTRKAWLYAGASAVALTAAAPGLAMADEELQGAPQADASEDEPAVERLVVTGSRLNTNPNLTSPNPVLGIDAEEIAIRGAIRIEDLTNILPQVFAAQTTEVSNGATGTSQLNLRGLGTVRTLVLIDGKRLPFGDSGVSSVNVDNVPARLVERVDIVTGGASAVYGSDAVGGVANFILRDDFEGVELDFQGGFSHSANNNQLFIDVLEFDNQPVPNGSLDGRELFGSAIIGVNAPDGRGNVTLSVSYQNLGAITQDDRAISACALSPDTSADREDIGFLGCVGSANFRLFGGGPAGFLFQEEDGTIVPFAGGAAQTFNFGPLNFFQRPVERFNLYTRSHYEITENLEVFLDASFFNNSSDAQIAQTASFGIGAYDINCDNPFIQDPIVDVDGFSSLADAFGCSADDVANGTVISGLTASHRNVEGGPRNSNLDNSTWRMVGGFRGTLFDRIDWDLFGQFARTIDTDISTNDFVVENLQEAFLVTLDDDGNAVCTSGNPSCVPYNIFQRTADGGTLVTQEALDFIQGVGITTGETQQFVFGGTAQSNLGEFGIKSPLTDAGVGLLVGFEYRNDRLDSIPDEISQIPTGGFTGVGGGTLPVSGEVRVAEFFMETQIPLITDLPFVEELSIGGAYRFSDYTNEGNDTTSGFGASSFNAYATWSPSDIARFRFQFQRSIRSPNVIELFTPQGFGLVGLTPLANGFFDPCAGPDPLATFEQCANSGVTADQFGNILDAVSGQAGTITGGNPDLFEEVADTYTVGAIFDFDRWIDNLVLSVDYFNITVNDTVAAGAAPANTILSECVFEGDPTFCGFIQRDAGGSLNSGTGTGFLLGNVNVAELSTAGVDFQITYNRDIGDFGFGDLGNISFNYVSTWLRRLDNVPFPGAETIETAGLFGGNAGTPNPTYRHRLLATWQTPYNVDVAATWRFFGGTDLDGASTGSPIDDRLETTNYFDLSLFWRATENFSFRAGANNLLGTQAPVTTALGPPSGNGNTAPNVFDTGRFVFFGVTARF